MPVVTIGRQFGAGGSTVGGMLADRLHADLLESRIIDEVAHRLQLPKEEVEAEDESAGSLLSRLLVALGSASSEPLIPPEVTAWSPPNADPAFDTRQAVLQITQHVIQEAARAGNVVIVGRGGAYLLSDFPGALHVFLRADTAVRVEDGHGSIQHHLRRRGAAAGSNRPTRTGPPTSNRSTATTGTWPATTTWCWTLGALVIRRPLKSS